jgi:hypothetical protein
MEVISNALIDMKKDASNIAKNLHSISTSSRMERNVHEDHNEQRHKDNYVDSSDR